MFQITPLGGGLEVVVVLVAVVVLGGGGVLVVVGGGEYWALHPPLNVIVVTPLGGWVTVVVEGFT
jgi:hypothetical protein